MESNDTKYDKKHLYDFKIEDSYIFCFLFIYISQLFQNVITQNVLIKHCQ